MATRQFTAVLLTLLMCGPVGASTYQPIPYADMGALTMHYGVPRITDATVLNDGEWQWQWSSEVGNTVHIQGADEDAHRLLIDLETQRHTAIVEYALHDDWNLVVEVPHVRHSRGSLDGFIDQFHDALGFPAGPRARSERDAFAIDYVHDGATLIALERPQAGLGDLSLSFLHAGSSHWGSGVRGGIKLKLPTGDADKLTGSGTYDVSFWGAASKPLFGNVSHHLSLAAVAIESAGGLLPEQRNNLLGAAAYGVAWRYSDRLEFKLQLNARTAVYRSNNIRALGHATAVSMGGTIHLSRGFAVDVAVIEDIDVGTSPDVVFQLALRHRPD